MKKINFINKVTPLRADTFNRMQNNIEEEFNEVNSQLAERAPNGIINGKLYLPSEFPTLPFDIFYSNGKYFCDLSAKKLTAKNATKVYISCVTGGTGLGNTPKTAISLNRFKSNLTNNLYSGITDFELIFMDKVYVAIGNDFELYNEAIKVTFRSGVGFTWIGRLKTNSKYTNGWTATATSGVYVTTQDTEHDIQDIINLSKLNEFGMPYLYTKVATLDECKLQEGTFYQDGTKIYQHAYNFHNYDTAMLAVPNKIISIRQFNERKVVFENMGFTADTLYLATDNILNQLYFINCRFHRGTNDAFGLVGRYQVYSYNCVADYPSKDCFNYHSFSKDSVAVEINCIGYGAGKHKMTYSGSNTNTVSNNGSTAHNGINVLRVGCSYWDCEGPIVADIQNCRSVNIGCSAKNIADTCSGERTAFLITTDISQNQSYRTEMCNKYIINCIGGGTNVKYGIVANSYTKIMNFRGNTNLKGTMEYIKWEGEVYE